MSLLRFVQASKPGFILSSKTRRRLDKLSFTTTIRAANQAQKSQECSIHACCQRTPWGAILWWYGSRENSHNTCIDYGHIITCKIFRKRQPTPYTFKELAGIGCHACSSSCQRFVPVIPPRLLLMLTYMPFHYSVRKLGRTNKDVSEPSFLWNKGPLILIVICRQTHWNIAFITAKPATSISPPILC